MKKSILLIFLSILLIFLTGGLLFSYSLKNNGKIYENIFIENVNVGNLSKKEAVDLIKSNYSIQNINLVHNNQKFTLNLNEIDFKFKVDEAVDKAYDVGRNGNFFMNIKKILTLKNGKQEFIELEKQYDEEKLDDFLASIENRINKEPKNATIQVKGKTINITKEENGYAVDIKNLKETILTQIEKNDYQDISIIVKEIHAQIKYEYLSKIDTLLGEYSTRFNVSNKNRTENVKLASQKVNGILLNPGEEFSFNDSTGKRGLSQGFKMAPVIIQGQLKEGVAGGVCQVSSTLYNAALYSGVTITDRRNHTIPSSYVDKGRDATVSYGSIDFKFKNNYQNPIYIESIVSGNNMISRIYGNHSDKKNIKITTNITKTIPRQVEIKEDPTMEKGKEEVKEKGRDGYKVETYRLYIENGNVIKKELISKSYYPPRKKIINRGTKETKAVETIKTDDNKINDEINDNLDSLIFENEDNEIN
ncbi:VanW family protein [Tepidibacter formicigenes]|uniref:Vancomycin resistance protein YoaR, contains peptidoglycan-binding and VanW domains n=1 Tax=Tepidibacter formicigenes DSM 15518 TaxID=1123349 RepID=A0A1M6N471_9FIRM|nr:VanW family protein [Tepidibacter formicigenes]SHJ90403.1 Vancomycin resistance protein YoaR, contains peptidoglycan-binding and VanW domains [Tepidibacter formicigenes DSM 15518]